MTPVRAAIIAIAAPRVAGPCDEIGGCVLTMSQVLEIEDLIAGLASAIARTPRSQQDSRKQTA